MTATIPLFADFIKDKLPARNYSNSVADWREYTVEYLIAHVLFKAGITEIRFCKQGLYQRTHFASLIVNNYVPVIYRDSKGRKEECPLFYALLKACGLGYSGCAGNESKPYAQACIHGNKIKQGYNGEIKIGRSDCIDAGSEAEFMKNIFCYFYQIKG